MLSDNPLGGRPGFALVLAELSPLVSPFFASVAARSNSSLIQKMTAKLLSRAGSVGLSGTLTKEMVLGPPVPFTYLDS